MLGRNSKITEIIPSCGLRALHPRINQLRIRVYIWGCLLRGAFLMLYCFARIQPTASVWLCVFECVIIYFAKIKYVSVQWLPSEHVSKPVSDC